MTNNIFCTNCGAEYTHRDVYCSNCGMSVEPEMSIIPSQDYQTHCTSCGTNIGVNYTYCAACGTECTEYIINTGVASQIMDVFGGLNVAESVANIAGKTVGIKNVILTLRQLGDRSTLAPAFLFAIVAVAVGLILSLVIDVFAVGVLEGTDIYLSTGTWDVFGMWFGSVIWGDGSFRLGFTTIWLLSIFGGLRTTASIESPWDWSYEYVESTISLGVIWLALVPVVALLIARAARNAYINSNYAGKEIKVQDGILGAGIFTIINLIIALFPTALGGNAQNFLERWLGSDASIEMTVRPIFFSLFLFSFAIALLFSMPKLHSFRSSEKIHSRIVGLSIGTAVEFAQMMIVAGFVIAVIASMYGLITFNSELNPTSDEFGMFAYGLLIALPNLTVWVMSFLTGGSLIGEFDAYFSANAFGAELADRWSTLFDISWFGLLIIVAGLWISITTVYKMLRNVDDFMASGIMAVITSSAIMWVISRAATIALDSSIMNDNYMHISTASSNNFLLTALFVAIAVVIVYLTRKVPTVDLIVKTLAKPAIALIVTAVAATVAVLTVSVNG